MKPYVYKVIRNLLDNQCSVPSTLCPIPYSCNLYSVFCQMMSLRTALTRIPRSTVGMFHGYHHLRHRLNQINQINDTTKMSRTAIMIMSTEQKSCVIIQRYISSVSSPQEQQRRPQQRSRPEQKERSNDTIFTKSSIIQSLPVVLSGEFWYLRSFWTIG